LEGVEHVIKYSLTQEGTARVCLIMVLSMMLQLIFVILILRQISQETTISPHRANTIVKEKGAHTPATQNHELMKEKPPSSSVNHSKPPEKALLTLFPQVSSQAETPSYTSYLTPKIEPLACFLK
jgi:hypothetical protein